MNILIKLRRILDRPSRLVIGVVLRYARLFNDQKALVYGMPHPQKTARSSAAVPEYHESFSPIISSRKNQLVEIA